MENTKKQLHELKTNNLDVLYEQEKKISKGLEKVIQEIKDCEGRLRSTDMESLLEHEVAKNDKNDILPTITACDSACYHFKSDRYQGIIRNVWSSNHDKSQPGIWRS